MLAGSTSQECIVRLAVEVGVPFDVWACGIVCRRLCRNLAILARVVRCRTVCLRTEKKAATFVKSELILSIRIAPPRMSAVRIKPFSDLTRYRLLTSSE